MKAAERAAPAFSDFIVYVDESGDPGFRPGARKRKAPVKLTEALTPTGHSQSTWVKA
ncbi:hypothetical protein [Pseudoduganella violacea]|uniref:Uncharacterized protein n=1 Tax=Pseudoduganella violacea TaxID=1715466 RepID=A0A7W5FWD9_9BURK|nr:hypothetical protein [Pseudoduganella violacea]MBB3121910.1 hypothetical protein [Pseudoduganella violacea]